jgi:hypothetical protein
MPVFILNEQNDPYTTGRQGWWKYSGDALDYSGYGRHMSEASTTYVTNYNGVGKAIVKEGGHTACSFVSVGHLSFYFWLNAPTFVNPVTYCSHYGAVNRGFRLRLNSTNWQLIFGNDSNTTTMENTHGLSINTWYHIAVMFDYTHIVTRYFVNGISVNNSSSPSLYWSLPEPEIDLYVSNTPYNSYISDFRFHTDFPSDYASTAHSIYKYIG